VWFLQSFSGYLEFLGSCNPPVSTSLVAWITDKHHNARLQLMIIMLQHLELTKTLDLLVTMVSIGL
jgi:hypothetical protein